MKSFFVTVLAISLQFSACIGLAFATQPALASTIEFLEIEEPMSPVDWGNSCEKAVKVWQLAEPGEGTGCQDTTTCIQNSTQLAIQRLPVLQKTVEIPKNLLAKTTVFFDVDVYTPTVADEPWPPNNVYSSYNVVQRE